jgi:hypothetical protein
MVHIDSKMKHKVRSTQCNRLLQYRIVMVKSAMCHALSLGSCWYVLESGSVMQIRWKQTSRVEKFLLEYIRYPVEISVHIPCIMES